MKKFFVCVSQKHLEVWKRQSHNRDVKNNFFYSEHAEYFVQQSQFFFQTEFFVRLTMLVIIGMHNKFLTSLGINES